MQEIETITFNGKIVEVKELTVKQVRDVFLGIDKAEPQFIDELLNEPIPAMIITECTGVSVDEMEKQKPSELKPLVEAVKAVNPTLASMILRRVEAYDQLKEAGLLSSKPFQETAAA